MIADRNRLVGAGTTPIRQIADVGAPRVAADHYGIRRRSGGLADDVSLPIGLAVAIPIYKDQPASAPVSALCARAAIVRRADLYSASLPDGGRTSQLEMSGQHVLSGYRALPEQEVAKVGQCNSGHQDEHRCAD